MRLFRLFCLVACLVCVNARAVKRQKQLRQICPNNICSRTISIVEPPCVCNSREFFGSPTPCNCQNFLEDLTFRCGCNIDLLGLNPELSRIPKSVASLPFNNMPGLYDFVVISPYQEIPGRFDFAPGNRQILPEYTIPMELPKQNYVEVQAYFIEPPSYQPRVVQYLPNIDCGCKNLPCSCQKPCDVYAGLPVEKNNCGCVQCGQQLPAMNYQFGFPCQGCQAAKDLSIIGYDQILPPPEVGCGKYLRQVTLQPPFI